MINKKCPKCGSRNFQLVDYYVAGYIYEVTDGVVEADGQDEGGRHVKTTCVCRQCGHQWHPRLKNNDFSIDK